MKVLVLGGSGYIGKRLLEIMANSSLHNVTGASRRLSISSAVGVEWIKLDTCDVSALTSALRNFDTVVNCVAGNAKSISQGTKALTDAAAKAGNLRIIHLSTMSVYGPVEGNILESAPLNPELGWYGRAKCIAEQHIRDYVCQGGKAVVLRPGCVYGENSELWVGRIARWLQVGRLGDLGMYGDGWSNLVHVDDVCQAILLAMNLTENTGELPVFNLAAPDSPRWNKYFMDLALALNFTPVKRINRRQIQLDSLLAGPPLKIAKIVSKRFQLSDFLLPDYMPPGLMSLWAQHIHLDSAQATQRLGLNWTAYNEGFQNSIVNIQKNNSSLLSKSYTAWKH